MNDIFMTIDTVKNDIEKMSNSEKRIVIVSLSNKKERLNHEQIIYEILLKNIQEV